MARAVASLCLLAAAHAQQVVSAPLMDAAMSSLSDLARARQITTEEEISAVQRILQNDFRLLTLAKHFGGSSTFATHVRTALQTLDPLPLSMHAQAGHSAPPTNDPLLMRRSIIAYSSADVPGEVVEQALEAAILAPNHFLSEPWRFYLAGPETRATLCALNEAKRETFCKVPGWLVVTLKSEQEVGSKLYYEDHAATSAAIQNFMLSLASKGIGSKWMTGALGVPPETVLAALDISSDNERFMGAIWFGYPETPLSPDTSRAPLRKRGLAGVLTRSP